MKQDPHHHPGHWLYVLGALVAAGALTYLSLRLFIVPQLRPTNLPVIFLTR